jgi:molybdopterin-dependent oxidoreductase alpha subunit
VRAGQTLLKLNQAEGFDCPGCAWPEPDHRSAFEFCENGTKAVAAEATRKTVGPAFFEQHSVEALLAQSDHWLEAQGRLTHPMVRRAGATHYAPISWDEAFALLGEALRGLASPDEALFYTSGRTSNEAAFLYQLFARQYGTNNLPDCSNMCHESSGTALSETVGVGKGTVSLADFDRADAIFILGQNPGTNHPRMLSALQAAARRGCKIVAINPLREAGLLSFVHPQEPIPTLLNRGTPLACLYLQVKINGDVALLKGIMKEVLAAERAQGGVLDRAFLEQHTEGWPALEADLDATSWEEVVAASGVPREQIQEAARIYIGSKATIACWAMGLTQHKNAVANIQQLVNLMLMRGNLGRPGAGLCPVRGHSNVQGDRTMGIYERPKAAFLDKLKEVFGFEPPRHHGHDTVAAIEAMRDGHAKVFFAMGGNFHSASPDTEATAAALRRCRVTAHVSTKLNRSHLVTGELGLILPCLGRTEIDLQAGKPQEVTVEDSMSVVHLSRGHLPPASPALLSEPKIVERLALATLPRERAAWWTGIADDYDAIRGWIAEALPGFEDFNARVRRPGGLQLPNSARALDFKHLGGKAHLTVHPIPRWELDEGQFLLMTLRSHDQYNTTIYGLDDRYRGIYQERRVLFIHPEDLRALALPPDARLTLTSHFEGQTREVTGFRPAPYDIPRGCLAAYFPETNPLVPLQSHADKSRTPTSKSLVVTLRVDDPGASKGRSVP